MVVVIVVDFSLTVPSAVLLTVLSGRWIHELHTCATLGGNGWEKKNKKDGIRSNWIRNMLPCRSYGETGKTSLHTSSEMHIYFYINQAFGQSTFIRSFFCFSSFHFASSTFTNQFWLWVESAYYLQVYILQMSSFFINICILHVLLEYYNYLVHYSSFLKHRLLGNSYTSLCKSHCWDTKRWYTLLYVINYLNIIK